MLSVGLWALEGQLYDMVHVLMGLQFVRETGWKPMKYLQTFKVSGEVSGFESKCKRLGKGGSLKGPCG